LRHGASPFLELRGIRKSFDGVVAVEGVDLTLQDGEIHALVGENGAGKSTLINVTTGVHRPDAGEIRVRGAAMSFRRPGDAEQAGVSAVYQELSLIDELDVAQNVFLHREPRRLRWLLDSGRLYEDCRELLERLNIDIDPGTPVESLSLARRQLVELAKALSRDASLVIMDEPTASLTISEQEHLFKILDGLRKRGLCVLYVSHRLEEIFRIADRVTVIRDGSVVRSMPIGETTRDEIVQLMVGRDLASDLFPPRPPRPPALSAPALEVTGLNIPPRVHDVSLRVEAGEIVALAGLIGSGRSSVLRAVFGAERSSGSIAVAGRPVSLRSPADALRVRIAMISEDRKLEGLALGLSNVANISATGMPVRRGLYSPRLANARAARSAERVLLRAPLDQLTRLLSGGNQQKVALAKWLATEPVLLLCDEPTRGVDVGAKAEVYRLLRTLADEGLAVLMASSDLQEVLGLPDRILVMADGRVVDEQDGRSATEESIMRAAASGVAAAES
jgi:ABC-type sugar transport system ATPase subunit